MVLYGMYSLCCLVYQVRKPEHSLAHVPAGSPLASLLHLPLRHSPSPRRVIFLWGIMCNLEQLGDQIGLRMKSSQVLH